MQEMCTTQKAAEFKVISCKKYFNKGNSTASGRRTFRFGSEVSAKVVVTKVIQKKSGL